MRRYSGMYRPACLMNHTGVQSDGFRHTAFRNLTDRLMCGAPAPRQSGPARLSQSYGAGLQPLAPNPARKPGASPRAGMKPRFQRSGASSEYGPQGGVAAAYHLEKVSRAEGPAHISPGRSPG